jgi:hypothetical protein
MSIVDFNIESSVQLTINYLSVLQLYPVLLKIFRGFSLALNSHTCKNCMIPEIHPVCSRTIKKAATLFRITAFLYAGVRPQISGRRKFWHFTFFVNRRLASFVVILSETTIDRRQFCILNSPFNYVWCPQNL